MVGDVIRDRRVQYETAGLDVDDVDRDPMVQWQRWHADAFEVGVAEPNAMTLGTVDADGTPDARIVLVRGADERGFAFFTNYASVKSRQLEALGAASAVFSWLDLHRQVRVRGRVERLDAESSDAYFASAAAPEPDRGVGVAPERGDRRPGRARAPRRRRRGAVRRVRRAPPTALGRVAAGPRGVRVLAGPPEPPPRPPPLPPRSAAPGRSPASPPEPPDLSASGGPRVHLAQTVRRMGGWCERSRTQRTHRRRCRRRTTCAGAGAAASTSGATARSRAVCCPARSRRCARCRPTSGARRTPRPATSCRGTSPASSRPT